MGGNVLFYRMLISFAKNNSLMRKVFRQTSISFAKSAKVLSW